MNKTCLSYWFPRIKDLPEIKVPRTEMVFVSSADMVEMMGILDGKKSRAFDHLVESLLSVVKDKFEYPVFLRTGLGSGKHEWSNTCFVPSAAEMAHHVIRLMDWSMCVDLSFDVWVLREMLEPDTVLWPTFHAFQGMPIVREFRCFGSDGKLTCIHPYWPPDAIRNPIPKRGWKKKLASISILDEQTEAHIKSKTEDVTACLGGYWSVDWLWCKNGWFLTDMAEGEKSFHWPGCERTECNETRG